MSRHWCRSIPITQSTRSQDRRGYQHCSLSTFIHGREWYHLRFVFAMWLDDVMAALGLIALLTLTATADTFVYNVVSDFQHIDVTFELPRALRKLP